MRVLVRIFLVLILLVSLGCGDDYSSYEKSCEEIKQMIDDELNALNYCSNDGECIMITLLSCYWVAINASASADTEKLNELEEEFIEKECSILCPLNVPTGVYCEEGKCILTGY